MDRPECQNLDRVLDAAVIVTWPDLITLGHSGIVHVEYDFGVKGNITFLRCLAPCLFLLWSDVRSTGDSIRQRLSLGAPCRDSRFCNAPSGGISAADEPWSTGTPADHNAD